MESTSNNSMILWVAIALIGGLVIGGTTGYASGMKKGEETTDDTAMMATSTPMVNAASDGVTVGGAKMVRTLDLVDNASNASNVTTLVSLVKLAGLVDTLKGAGPFTVFGPSNDAFAKLPSATVASLQQPENKATLTSILTYHVVPGTYTSADLRAMAAKGETLASVQGALLTPMIVNNKLMLKDVAGSSVGIETADVISSNGVTHVVDTVLMPTK